MTQSPYSRRVVSDGAEKKENIFHIPLLNQELS